MSVNDRHPLYTEMKDDWETMRHTYKGERTIKRKTTLYLPATSGQVEDGLGTNEKGWVVYNAYLKRAVFHSFVKDAVETAIGIMHRKPARIKLPANMEYLVDRASTKGESLQMLLRKINEEQLVTGRIGLLADLPVTPSSSAVPYIATYTAESIINWDAGSQSELTLDNLNLVVLDESGWERVADFKWETVDKYRVLILGETDPNEPVGSGAVYRTGVHRAQSTTVDTAAMTAPSLRGKTLQSIPFTFINAADLVVDPDDPPLSGLGSLSLAIYRGEADYRQSLFMQGQDTLVVSGGLGEENVRVGSNAVLNLPVEGSAAYVGVDSSGLSEQREALENDKIRAAQMGGQLLDSVSRERESGDSLKRRTGAQTATFNQIVRAGAEGLQTELRMIAEWMGEDPKAVSVEPNMEFSEDELTGRTLVEFMTAKTLGVPLSLHSLHRLLKERGLTELELEEELAKIEEEQALSLGGPGEEDDDGGA